MKIIKPREELREFVRYYWVLESNEPFSILTFPIGCPQIIFHRKTPLYIPELDKSQDPFTISGQVNFPAHLQSDGNLEMIVAVFYPHAISQFINIPPSAFYNLEISGYDLENRQLDDIASCIFDSNNHSECINILENWLLRNLKPSLNIKRTANSIYQLITNPTITIQKLADTACLSRKQFERIFLDSVGMNPKEYAKIVRFQRSIWSMQCGDRNFAGIAAECGYSDQSHFIREFKSMTGMTPKTLLTYCQPYSDLFTNPI
ncbi:MAG: helix-turn-helix transcriptional regulator [Muribaculaceae bacterium]|nr:helix-turn-helix transcriptional regulator [Muribaculaceae bacterium]